MVASASASTQSSKLTLPILARTARHQPPPRSHLRFGSAPHCDSTLLTLLWADAPGLQVLEPRRAEALGWRPQHVLGLGLPTMMPLPIHPTMKPLPERAGAAAPSRRLHR